MGSIFHRTSIRKYKNQIVEKEKIERILKAAMQAPSARNQQPWEFFVVTNKKALAQLSKASPYTSCVKDAPLAIVVAMHKEAPSSAYVQIDCAMCSENILLEATRLGLGAVFLGIAPLYDRIQKVNTILHLPEEVDAFGIIPIGYPDEQKEQISRYTTEKVNIIQ